MATTQVQPLPDLNQCPGCGNRSFITNFEGLKVCAGCGMVDETPVFRQDLPEAWRQGQLVKRNEWVPVVFKNMDGRGRPLTATQREKYTHLHFRDLQYRHERGPVYAAIGRARQTLEQLPISAIVRNMAFHAAEHILKAQPVQNAVTMLAACVLQAARKISPGNLSLQQCVQMFAANGHGINARLLISAWESYKGELGASPAIKSIHYLESIVAGISNIDQLWARVQFKTDHLHPSPYTTIVEYLTALRAETCKVLEATPPSGVRPQHLTAAAAFCADKILARAKHYPSILTQELLQRATGVNNYTIRDLFVHRLKPVFQSQLRATSSYQNQRRMICMENKSEAETSKSGMVEVATQSNASPASMVMRVSEHLQKHPEGQTKEQVCRELKTVNSVANALRRLVAIHKISWRQLDNVKGKSGRIPYVYFWGAGPEAGIPAKPSLRVNSSGGKQEITHEGDPIMKLPSVADFVQKLHKDDQTAWQALKAAVPAAGSILTNTQDYAIVAQLGKVLAELGGFLDQHPMPGGCKE